MDSRTVQRVDDTSLVDWRVDSAVWWGDCPSIRPELEGTAASKMRKNYRQEANLGGR